MRAATYQVFDQIISGTATTWYSGSDFDRLIGQSDILAYEVYPTNVPNTTSTLTITQQYSWDSQNWVSMPAAIGDIAGGPLTNNVALAGMNNGFFIIAPFVRFAIQLGGPSPSCRLKVYVTSRVTSQKG